MIKFFKYLTIIPALIDLLRKAYIEKTNKRCIVVGSIMAIVGSVIAMGFGVSIEKDTIDTITENTNTIITALIALYGAAMTVLTAINNKDKDGKDE